MSGLKIWFVGQFAFYLEDTPNTTVFQVSAALFCWTIANVSFIKTIVLADLYVVRHAFFFFLSIIEQFSIASLFKCLDHLLLFLHQSAPNFLFCSTVVLTLNARKFLHTLLLALKIEAGTLTSFYVLRCRTQLFRRNRRYQVEIRRFLLSYSVWTHLTFNLIWLYQRCVSV